MKTSKLYLTTLLILFTFVSVALAQPSKDQSAPRLLAFISDLHMGIGRVNGVWDRKEDFRWPNALKGLLNHISEQGDHRVDLVIVGDFLEFWQPPDGIYCAGPSADLGCTSDELKTIAGSIVAGHTSEFKALREFALRDANRLYLIPGNHDSALLLPPVWDIVLLALGGEKKVTLVSTGVWTSRDGRVIVEHGHQIGSDANRYSSWPGISRIEGGKTYIIQPWGERFVQQLFNEEEEQYSIIDNLSPETAGARYRLADRGLWHSIEDLARFVSFNLWETSLNQKGQFLGRQQDDTGRPIWSMPIARQLGYKLIAGALPNNDPFRVELLSDSTASEDLRKELDQMVADDTRLTDEEARLLCDMLAIRQSGETCDDPTLGYTLEKALIPREWVMREHLRERLKEYKRMNVFIYGHTHKYEKKWRIDVTSLSSVNVLNTGAFQRLIDDEQFLELIESKGIKPNEGLRQLTPDDLPPCYTVVLVPYENGFPEPKLYRWNMPEESTGRLIDPDVSLCK